MNARKVGPPLGSEACLRRQLIPFTVEAAVCEAGGTSWIRFPCRLLVFLPTNLVDLDVPSNSCRQLLKGLARKVCREEGFAV